MIKKLKAFLGLHNHEFADWGLLSSKVNDYGGYIFVQSRICKTCGLIEYSKTKI